ncbi:MAG: hypothetical protein LUQ01_03090 [Methanolinea sp.]|nr:hypothetical protein [Methanolinea sp.]
MPPTRREEALSEVIGFILILALIAGLASLYLTYVVPAQGREGEIRHMTGINDQFLAYKTGVDSLWINDQASVPISRTFSLGTPTGVTQGSFVIPLFQPYSSSGTMIVNGRGETITINADALVQGFPGTQTPNLDSIHYEPDHVYIQVMTTNISKYGGLVITPTNGNWSVVLNVTSMLNPNTTFTGVAESSFPPVPPLDPNAGASVIRDWINKYLINWTSAVEINMANQGAVPILSMTMVKNNNSTFSRLPVYSNIQNNRWYTIDLLDDAYGLENELKFPFKITISNSTSNWIQYRYPVPVGYLPGSLNESHTMGALEYRSDNNYWIQQNYYYQQGGVFLEQPGDGMVAKVIPFIHITYQNEIPTVRIVDLAISGSGNIGGTSPVQVVTTLDSVSGNTGGGITLAQGIPNAREITITITAQDPATAQMWNQTFSGIIRGADPRIRMNTTQTGTQAKFSISGSDGSDYDLILDYTRVNLTVELQPIAI